MDAPRCRILLSRAVARAAHQVFHDDVGAQQEPETCLTQSPSEIDIFVVEEVALVEAADLQELLP